MTANIAGNIAYFESAPLKELQRAYAEHFPGKKCSNNRTYLWRRIAYKIQESEYGKLSLEARKKLEYLMVDYDPVNNPFLKPLATPLGFNPKRDRRLPLPGTILAKNYKNAKILVKVLEKGFEYQSKIYKSLTAVAKEVTENHCNGFAFFNL